MHSKVLNRKENRIQNWFLDIKFIISDEENLFYLISLYIIHITYELIILNT